MFTQEASEALGHLLCRFSIHDDSTREAPKSFLTKRAPVEARRTRSDATLTQISFKKQTSICLTQTTHQKGHKKGAHLSVQHKTTHQNAIAKLKRDPAKA